MVSDSQKTERRLLLSERDKPSEPWSIQRMKGPIQSLSVSYLAHATEDDGLVVEAVKKYITGEVGFDKEELEGHYGNAISHVEFHLTGTDAEQAFSRIVRGLSEESKRDLLRNISDHVDEHSALFLRLDKQRLVSGTLCIGETDPVRVKVKPRVFLLKGGGAKFYSDLIAGGG